MKAKLLVTILTAMNLIAVAGPTNAQANTKWHKGIPQRLRGNWLQKTGKYRFYCVINKSQVYFIANGHGSGDHFKVQIKYVGNHTWKYRQKSSLDRAGGWEYGTLHYMNSRHKLHTNGTTFHKVSKVTF
ncbi:hypothetical protein ACS4N0_07960 [Levilactobacillus zymae]|uniref:hypothetical protein n=1 Tax=Levilactobacillus zymae TaxID=267363 RepID=UPI003FCE8A3C